MNAFFADDDVRLLDLLVDGELDAAKRRELLAKLDRDPGGWKRCALAFLEAQAWSQATAHPPTADQVKPIAASSIPPTTKSSPPRKAWATRSIGLAWAAGLLAAFAAGWSAKDWSAPNSAPSKSSLESPIIAASSSSNPNLIQKANNASRNLEARPNRDPSIREFVVVPVAWTGTNDWSARWLREPESLVSEAERRRWSGLGYEVSETKRLIPVPLDNGETISIPMGEVELRFVGRVIH